MSWNHESPIHLVPCAHCDFSKPFSPIQKPSCKLAARNASAMDIRGVSLRARPRSAKIGLHRRLRASCPALRARNRNFHGWGPLVAYAKSRRDRILPSVAATVSPHLGGPLEPPSSQSHKLENRTKPAARIGCSSGRPRLPGSWTWPYEAAPSELSDVRLPLPRSSSGHRETSSRRPAPRRD